MLRVLFAVKAKTCPWGRPARSATFLALILRLPPPFADAVRTLQQPQRFIQLALSTLLLL
jgi:hypothetical protein